MKMPPQVDADMGPQRRTVRPPLSTGAMDNGSGNTAARLLSLSSSRSSDSLLDDYANRPSYKSKSADLRDNNHGNVQSSLYNGSGPGGTTRRRRSPTKGPMLPRGLGGFEDPAYAVPAVATKRHDAVKGPSSPKSSGKISIPVAVLLWYLLGVISIATSKVLLSTYNVPPFVLTMQQLIMGMTLLRILLEMQSSGEGDKDRLLRRGVQPIPIQARAGSSNADSVAAGCPDSCEAGMLKRTTTNDSVDSWGALSAIFALTQTSSHSHIHNQLFLVAIYFTLGFLLTNFGFQSGSAAFVETVKAAEPITSASVAVLWGIEQLGTMEVTSLTSIVAGVVLSTMGHRGGGKSSELDIPSQSMATKCLIVMLSNLCFSFRGLHQKLFRATPQGHASMVNDLNLQYRMQQIGVLMMIVPTVLINASWALRKLQNASLSGSSVKQTIEYVLIMLVNGLAFTSYNLASTYVLTRISVVHHASLNCIRRVFAIVVTSLIFGLKITMLQVSGICLAVSGFFSYIHFKMKKEVKDKRRNELRKKWGGLMKNSKSGKWSRESSSLLPERNGVQ